MQPLRQKGEWMIHHYITKYKERGKYWAEAWIQIDLFGKSICFCRRKIEIKSHHYCNNDEQS